MVTPGLSQAVGAEIASQTNLLADRSNELPGLATTNRDVEIIGLRIEKEEMLWIAGHVGVGHKIFVEYLPDACIDKDLVAFATFLLFDLETAFDTLLSIHNMPDPQT